MSKLYEYAVSVNVEDTIEQSLVEAAKKFGEDSKIMDETRGFVKSIVLRSINDNKIDLDVITTVMTLAVYDSFYTSAHSIPLPMYEKILEELSTLIK